MPVLCTGVFFLFFSRSLNIEMRCGGIIVGVFGAKVVEGRMKGGSIEGMHWGHGRYIHNKFALLCF